MRGEKAFLVVGTGANGPLGLNALQCATAVRALQFEPLPTRFTTPAGSPIGVGRALSLGDLEGLDRWVALGAPALREASEGATAERPLAAFIATHPASPAARGRDALERLARASGVELDARASALIFETHAGFAIALERAKAFLYEHPGEVLVGAIDTPLDAELLARLVEQGKVYVDEDGERIGRIPAEAAAFVRLAHRPRRKRDDALAEIVAVEVDQETWEGGAARLLERVPREGDGERGGVEWILSDLNGERSRSDEWAASSLRSAVVRDALHDELVPHTGDTGAATGALLFVVAHELARMGAAPAGSVSIVLHSDGPTRAMIHAKLPSRSGPVVASARTPAKREVRGAKAARRRAADPLALAQMNRAARSCLEDLGSMGLLLAPGEVDPSRDPSALAQRLLDNFDALVALATPVRGARPPLDVLAATARYLGEVTPPDRARRFAAAFVHEHLSVD